jgi:isopenicillin N synthase-like dioxygenase
METNHNSEVPVIDVNPLGLGTEERSDCAAKIGEACREYGFFYIIGHRVREDLQEQLERLSADFFLQRGGEKWVGSLFMFALRD